MITKHRRPLIAGNWKLNNTIEEGTALAKAIDTALAKPCKADVLIAPPFTAIAAIVEALRASNSQIKVAGQDVFWEDSGAFTGAISAPMLKDAGAAYAIVGHSERRQYFHETDETVNKKIRAALKSNLIPIVCVGETLNERESGNFSVVINKQVRTALQGFTQQEAYNIVVAYEPVWAIGTGKTATALQAEEVHALIRGILKQEFGNDAAGQIKILYGGSVKPDNSSELLMQENIDGALVGGASLKADQFLGIINSV